MRKTIIILLIIFPTSVFAQKSVTEVRNQILKEFELFLSNTKNLDSAQLFIDNALNLSRSIGDSSLLCQAMDYSGWILHNRAEYLEAIVVYKQALSISRQVNNGDREAIILNHIQNAYSTSGMLDSALYFGYQSLEKRIELKDTAKMVNSYTNLASIYYKLEYYEEAIPLLLRVHELQKMSAESFDVVGSYTNLYTAYWKINKQNEANRVLEELIEHCKSGCRTIDYARINLYRGISLYKSDEYEKSILVLEKAEKLAHEVKDPLIYGDALRFLGLVSLKQGNEAQFLSYLNKSLASSKKSKLLNSQASVYENLSEFYVSKEQFKLAFEYKTANQLLIDSIQSTRTTWNVNRIHSDLVRKKSDEVIAQKELIIDEKERANMFLQLAGGLSALIILGGTLSFQVIRRKNRTIKNQNQELSMYNFELLQDIDSKENELSSTRQSVNTVISRISHDVRGKVATLKLLSTLTKSDNPQVQDYLSKITRTAKDADETIAGITALSRIRSKELNIERISLPPRLLKFFESDEVEFDNFAIHTDNVLLILVLDHLAKINGDSRSRLVLTTKFEKLIVTLQNVKPGDEWKDYLLSSDDFQPHLEFELMQIKVAVSRLEGRIRLENSNGQSNLYVEIPQLTNEE